MHELSIYEYKSSAARLAVPLKEILRYMGADPAKTAAAAGEEENFGTLAQTETLAQNALSDVKETASPSLLYSVFEYRPQPPAKQNPVFDAGFGKYESRLAASYLSDCIGVVFFAATIGIGPDMLSARYKKTVPSRALAVNAAGAALIESFCDEFCEALPHMSASENPFGGRHGLSYKTRISPGYGDMPLACQDAILTQLDAYRRLGLRLNESLLMTPSKSVTAIIGVKQEVQK